MKPAWTLVVIAALLTACGSQVSLPDGGGPDGGSEEGTISPAAHGTIAYIHGTNQIRLIEPDGSDDRVLWSHPDEAATAALGVAALAWSPDARTLAFASGHEATRSWYQSDIFRIGSDGNNYGRISNPPDPAEFAAFPGGRLTVTVENAAFDPVAGPFIVYVAGADEPQGLVLGPGGSQTVVFDSVADFGAGIQPVVVIAGELRWYRGVDVVAAGTADAGRILATANSGTRVGANLPSWRADGSEVAFVQLGCGGAWRIASDATAGTLAAELTESAACLADWGPASRPDELIYVGGLLDNRFYLLEPATGNKTELFEYAGGAIVLGLDWLPDGSGFIFSYYDYTDTFLYRYRFADASLEVVSTFPGEIVGWLSLSGDGGRVVFERAATAEAVASLWILQLDDLGLTQLVAEGRFPSWAP